MNTRQTWWLAGTALALFLFIFITDRRGGGRSGDAASGTLLVPGLQRAAVTALDLTPAGGPTIRLRKPQVFWFLESPVRYPGQSGEAEQWLTQLEKATWAVRLSPEEIRGSTAADFGLEPSRLRVVLQQGGETIELHFGNDLAVGRQCYVRVGDSPDILITDSALIRYLPQTVAGWRDRSLVMLSTIVQSNRFTFDFRTEVKPEATGYTLEPDPATARWRILKPINARGDRSKIEQLIRLIATWRTEDYVTDDPAADLLSYGLLPPEQELVLSRGSNSLLTVQFGRSPTNRPDLVYARQLPGSNIVLTARTNLDVLRLPYTVWRERRLLNLDTNLVQEIVGAGSSTYRIRQATNQTWQVVEPDPLPVDGELVQEFFLIMNSVQASGFEKDVVTDFGEYGLASPARQFSFLTLTNGISTNRIPSLSFGTNANNLAFARRSDEEAVYAIPLEVFHVLPVAHWQWRDRQVWKFATNEVRRVRLSHDGRTREVDRRPEGSWALAPGSNGVLELSFEEAVHQISNLRADRWMARGPGGRDHYGFTPDGLKVAIEWTRNGINRTNTVEFGGVNQQGKPFAATTLEDGQEWIFEFPVTLYYEFVRRNFLIPGGE